MSKVTDYAALASPAADDLLPVVDVHDTSMAPTGTTKKVTLTSLAPALLAAGGGTLGAALVPKVVTLAQSGGNVAVNATQGNDFRLLLTASGWAIATPAGPADGQDVTLSLIQDVTGGRTVTWGAGYHFGLYGPPVLSLAGGSADVLAFKYLASLGQWVFLGSNVPLTVVPLTQGGTGQSVDTGAALLASLGAVSSQGGVLEGALAPAVVTLADAVTTPLDASLGNVFEWLLGGSHTLAVPLSPQPGQVITVDVQQPSSGGPFTPAFTTGVTGGFSFGTGGAPGWSVTAGAIDTISFRYCAQRARWLTLGWKTGF